MFKRFVKVPFSLTTEKTFQAGKKMRKHLSTPPTECSGRANQRFSKIESCLIALLSFMLLSSLAFGQGTSASLSGTITDASQAVLPGAAVVATNTDTGVETKTTSNNSGVYNFPSLPPGSYNVTVEAPGFSRAVRELRLGLGQSRLNFSMVVAGTVTEIAVTGAVESLILEAGSSTGTVMQQEMISEIPLVGTNIMEFINLMGGVVPNTDYNNLGNQTFAGVAAQGVNVSRDGMTVNEVRWTSGVSGNSGINPEVIGEFKMVLSAVDAEMGRGAGQVQMTTRSGSNAFHGSGVWNIQNTVLDAQEFERKRRKNPSPWRNLNDYILSVSGPIIKNRTFFFASWEQQLVVEKQQINARVLTPCARKGIYRYISGWVPQNITQTPATGNIWYRPSVTPDGSPLVGPTQILLAGSNTPLPVGAGPTAGNPYDFGELRFESVLGILTPENRTALSQQGANGAYGDCESLAFNWSPGNDNYSTGATRGVIDNSFWAPQAYRSAYDPTNFVGRFTNGAEYIAGTVKMPPVNNWDVGDGLNVAGFRWTYGQRGVSSIWGAGGDPERKSFTLKIDHNINNEHRVSGTWNFEKFSSMFAQQQWPAEYGGYGGFTTRDPQNFMFNVTSTIRPTLLNEARFGYVSSKTYINSPLDTKDSDVMYSVLKALMPTGTGSDFAGSLLQDRALVIGPGEGDMMFSPDPYTGYLTTPATSHPMGNRDPGGVPATWGGVDHRWTIADTVTWMKGAHSFKGGVEYRLQDSYQNYTGARSFNTGSSGLTREPVIYGGTTSFTRTRRAGSLSAAQSAGTAWRDFSPGSQDLISSTSGNYTNAYALMTYFSGSMYRVNQYFFQSPSNPTEWNDLYGKNEDMFEYKVLNREFSFFFKDDWKLTGDLTLNLGVRYEFYGVPYAWNGRTLAIKGESANVFGISKAGGWDRWMNNREYVSTNSVTNPPAQVLEYEYVGPDSANPSRQAWNNDLNNFAPHVGFAWQLPWLGKGRTTLRGGYSINYTQLDTFDNFAVWVVTGAGSVETTHQYSGEGSTQRPSTPTELNTSYYMDYTDLKRIVPIQVPSSNRPMQGRKTGQLNGSATVNDDGIRSPMVHSLNMSLTRNIGKNLTADLRYIGTLSRNQITTTNLNSVNYLANDFYKELIKVRTGEESLLINSLFPAGTMVAGAYTGSEQLRRYSSTNANLARGNFNSVTSTLATGRGIMQQLDLFGNPDTNFGGQLSRAGCLPGDRQTPNDITTPCARPIPWNYFVSNPQYSSATLRYNGVLTNYHSMQAQVTMRPTHGFNFQATYTWSRMLTNGSWTNYLGDRFEDRIYILAGQHRSHALSTYGAYTLPFGSDGFFFRNASGAFKKAIEGWQLSWITSMYSGMPDSITGNNTLWSDSRPIIARPDLWDNKAGKAVSQWTDDGIYNGVNYFGRDFTTFALDTGICNETVQGYLIPSGPNRPHSGLYESYCSASYDGVTGLPVPVSGAPRVLALASGVTDGAGRLLPALYEKDTIGADGVLYKAGTPIVIFRNADQTLGADAVAANSYKGNQITGPGRISFDLAMSKSVEFMEGKRLEFRVDAQNILNHPSPSATLAQYGANMRNVTINHPSFGINGTGDSYGYITTKVGHRTFQARLRLSF